jgi:hypothetical protein
MVFTGPSGFWFFGVRFGLALRGSLFDATMIYSLKSLENELERGDV